MTSVFISYAREDFDQAKRISRSLRSAGAIVWIDTDALRGGDTWRLEIRKHIQNADYVVALLSQYSVSKDGFVQSELKIALERMESKPVGARYVIPVRLDPCEPADPRLHELHWIDMFRSWRRGLRQLRATLELQKTVRAATSDLIKASVRDVSRPSSDGMSGRKRQQRGPTPPATDATAAVPRSRITLDLSRETRDALRDLANTQSIPVAEVLRRAIQAEAAMRASVTSDSEIAIFDSRGKRWKTLVFAY